MSFCDEITFELCGDLVDDLDSAVALVGEAVQVAAEPIAEKKHIFALFQKKHSNSNTVCIPFQDGRLQPVLLAHGSVAVVVAEGEGDAETELNI